MGMRFSVSFRVVPGWTLSAISTPVTGEDRFDAAKQDKDKARPSCWEELPTSGERAVHIHRLPQRVAPLAARERHPSLRRGSFNSLTLTPTRIRAADPTTVV